MTALCDLGGKQECVNCLTADADHTMKSEQNFVTSEQHSGCGVSVHQACGLYRQSKLK